jgi:hypothetical protein
MSTLNVSNISDGTDTVATGYVVNGSAKAWVVVGNAGTTLDINGSFNVSSANDNGTGDFSYSLTTSFASEDFSQQSTYRGQSFDKIATMNSGRVSASLMATETSDPHTQALQDQNHALVAFGDLA